MECPHGYISILVESFRSYEPGHRYPIEVRPCPGEAFEPELLVECPMEMRENYPIGTVFRICAKLKDTSFPRSHLYTSYKWPFDVVSVGKGE